jgi:Zn finger protein HypA/HybF involved in hydrogenase expression
MSPTTTVNAVPSVTLAADCDRHPRPTERRAACPECAIVVDLAKITPLRISHLEFYECPVCSIGSLRVAWSQNLVTVKKA